MKEVTRILIVEDKSADADLAKLAIQKVLKDCIFQVVETREDFLTALENFRPTLILSDYTLPRFDGMKALQLALKHTPLTPLIIWTGSISEDIAVECMKAGANNYILKDNIKRLGPALIHALEERQLLLERKQAEEALHNSEKRFRALIENGLDNISLLEADGTLIWESPAAIRMLEYAPDEYVGYDIFALMHPDDLAWTRDLYAKLIQEPGSHKRGTFRLRRADGTWRWVDAIVTNMLNDPSVNAIVVNYRDVTEQRQAEEALRESQSKYQNLVETSHDLIWSVDAEGKITFLNRAAREIYGREPEELIGHSFFEIMNSQHYLRDSKEFETSIIDLDELKEVETYVQHKDGRQFILSANSKVVRNADGKITGITGSSRNITERKRAEEALRESENRLIMALAGAQMSVWEWNLQTNTIFWSPELFEITGVTRGHLDETFESFTNLIHQEDVDRVRMSAEKALADQSLFSEEFRIIRPDGEIRWLSNLGHAEYDSDHKNVRLIGTIQDITQRKQAELERQTLLEIMQGFANTKDLQELLKLVHHSIAKVIYAENFFVVLYQQNSGLFEEIYSVDQHDPPAPPSKLEKSITSYVFRSGKPLLLSQERFDELAAQGEVVLVGTNSESWLGVPLKTSGKTIGVIAVQDYERPNRYSEHEKDFLESIATQVALAIAHKQAEEALRESEEHYRTIFEGVQDAIFVESVDGKILMANEQACEMFGYSQAEFLTKSVTDLVPSGHLMLTAGGKDIPLFAEPRETMNQRANGESFPVEISGRLQEINGETVLLVVVRDITERKQAEEALHKSEALYRRAIEIAGAVPYYETYYDEGRSIKYEFIGEGIRQITGYGPEEFNEELWDSLVEEVNLVEDLSGYSLEDGLQLVRMGNNTNWKCEHRLRDRNGKIHWVFEAAVELRDENGISYGSIGTYQDITERKQAEESLRAEREKAQKYLDIAGVMMLALDRDGIVTLINQKGCEILGYSAGEIIDRDWIKTFLPEVIREEMQGVFQQLISGDIQPVGYYENTVLTKSGEERLIAWHNIVVRDHQGTIISTLSSGEDITERKQAESAEREQRALAEALRDTAETLSSTLDYGEVLDQILAAVGRVVPHDAATIMLIEGESAHVVRSYGYDQRGFNFEIMGIELPLAETNNLRQMLETKQTVVVYDTHSYPGWKRFPATDWLHSNVGAPISIHGDVIGFILLDSQTLGFFNPVHAERLEAFANQAALAIHNAHLLQQAQEEIAERKQAEAQLRASEERFRQLADNIEEAFWMTDAESDDEIYISQAAEVIWEQPIKALISEPKAFINSVFPEDQPAVLQAIEKEKNGEKVEIEYRILRPNGSVRWVWDRAFPIFDDTGKVKRIAGLTADITERRESEMALVKSQSRYRELFDSSPISIWEEDYTLVKKQLDLLTESGATDLKEYFSTHPEEVTKLSSLVRVTDINKASLELYQVEDKEDLLNSLTQVMGNEPLNHLEEEILGLMSPSKRFVWEGADKTINGRQMEVIVNGSIPEGYEKDWSKVIVSIMDITDRRHAEQQLRKLSRAVEQSGSTIVITDTAGNIEYVNPKFTEITGYSYEEVMGQNPRILKSGFTSDTDYTQLWQAITSGRVWHGELLNKKKNNELYWEYVTISPIFNERGEITHFVGVKEDITQRKQSEMEIRRHVAELEALYETGLAVGQLLKPNEIGNRVINTFARYLPWHHVTIRLRKEESDDLELVAFNLPDLKEEKRAETEQHFVALVNKVGQGLSGWVMQTGMPFRTGNVYAHSQYIDTHAGIQSGLYMPLKVGERIIGVISVESETPDAFTEQDERLLATLANQAAIAFENAQLYESVQKELSERKRVEDALRTSETHYRELADSITDILFELDQDLHYTHWNRASEILTGVPAKDAIGKSMYGIFGASEEQTRIRQIYESVLKEHQSKTFETILNLNGHKRSFEINAYPSTRGVSVVAKDVTERKRSEIIMQKRFELMEYSAQHSLDELMQRTIDEISDLTGSSIGFLHFVEADQVSLGMQTWSTNALRLFQVPASEGTHRSLDQAGVWAEAAHQRHPLIQNDYESLPNRNSIPQGHVPIMREIIIPIIRNERIMAMMGIANKPQDYTQHDLEVAEHLADYAWDITERKQMEIALEAERNRLAQRVDERTADLSRANSNLARALRVKDEFLANMSHELRTPLNAILGLSESLSEQIAGPLNDKQQKYIATISESGHHLLSLINDILDLAKIDAGQITLDINKVDIHSVCQASLRMIKQLAQKKNQEVSLEIDDGLGLIWADERRLKQMIVNLLGNAVKFTPENGNLGLKVQGDEEANKISFTVWDNGIGIKDDDLARLFQPFVQLDSGLARESTGTGLGLALVAQMARLHGGSITAFSEPEHGSRFTIILPWEPALAMDAATRMKITGKFRAIQTDQTNKATILLVEDTKEVTMMIKDYLELAGYKVVTAQDGVDAIVQAKLVRPDLILMDVQMPRMDGLEATRKLRSEPDFRYTPIIALTALAMPSDREHCLQAGMDEYLSKPVNLKALVKMIQGCLFSDREVKLQ